MAVDIAELNGKQYTVGAFIRAADTMSKFILNGEVPEIPDVSAQETAQEESQQEPEADEDAPESLAQWFWVLVQGFGEAVDELLAKVEGNQQKC